MQTTDRPIFRPEAVKRYIEGKNESVLPKLVSPRVSIPLWVLVVLLIFGTVSVWFTETPVYESVPAIVVDSRGVSSELGHIKDEVVLLLLLPQEVQPTVSEGNRVLIHLGTAGRPLEREVVIFESSEATVDKVLDNFGLGQHPAVLSVQAEAVAFVQLEPLPGNRSATSLVGALYRADLHIGSRPVASLFPVVGRLP